MRAKVEKIIAELKAQIQLDGGDIELVGVDEKAGTVTVKFQGACVGCPMSSITLHAGIEQALKQKVPQVKQVIPLGLEDDEF